MKKLMIAFAAIALAAGAQAAQFYWQFGNTAVNNPTQGWTYRTDGQQLTGYTLYVLNATAWDSTDVAGSLDKALVSSEISTENGWTINENPSVISYASGTKKVTGADLTVGSTFDAIFVVSNGEKYWASDAVKGVSAMEDDSIDTGYKVAALQLQNASAIMQADMQAVPEPTSGLLLLLGVAGLALKRKRA